MIGSTWTDRIFGSNDLGPDEGSWSVKTRKPKQKRIHRPTLALAIAQARKAGIAVAGATIAADGSVALEFGSETAAKPNGHAIETADELRKLI